VGFFLQIVAAAILAAVFQSLWPHVLRLVKPYAVRAAGVVPSGWRSVAVAFVLGCVVGVVVGGGVKLPSINWDWSKVIPPNIVTPAKGERVLVIVRESEEDDTKFSGLIGELRAAEYLKSKGHSLVVFDDDDQDKDGKPVPILDKLKPFLARELVIIEKSSGKVLSRGECPSDTAAVVAAVQKVGG
jgi:hypothetical protein